jgi:hypothetical protein
MRGTSYIEKVVSKARSPKVPKAEVDTTKTCEATVPPL